MTPDERRTAALLFGEELRQETLSPPEIDRPEVATAVASRGRRTTSGRYLDRLALKCALLDYNRHVVEPLCRAREAVLGADAAGPPRLLVRVDEFPHFRAWDEPRRYGTDAFARFHEIMRIAGVAYLVAVPSRVARHPLDSEETAERELDDGELAMLEQLRREGVSFGVHGWNHRPQRPRPRLPSELSGLDSRALEALLDRIEANFEALGISPSVFVPPFNRFDVRQLPVLARRYEVVCGGPETVTALGFRRTPLGLTGTVYLPSYPPFYAEAAEVLTGVRRLEKRRAALWTPVVLHWGWEADRRWEGLKRFADEVAPLASRWERFFEAARRSTLYADTGAA